MLQCTFRGPDFTSPETFVESFAADYRVWHDAVMAVHVPLSQRRAGTRWSDLPEDVRAAHDRLSEAAADAYALFLRPFLAQGVRLQGVAYGGAGSFFDPERLTITGTSAIEGGVEVLFSHRDASPDSTFMSDFSAEIETGPDGALKLKQVWLIDGKERLPCL